MRPLETMKCQAVDRDASRVCSDSFSVDLDQRCTIRFPALVSHQMNLCTGCFCRHPGIENPQSLNWLRELQLQFTFVTKTLDLHFKNACARIGFNDELFSRLCIRLECQLHTPRWHHINVVTKSFTTASKQIRYPQSVHAISRKLAVKNPFIGISNLGFSHHLILPVHQLHFQQCSRPKTASSRLKTHICIFDSRNRVLIRFTAFQQTTADADWKGQRTFFVTFHVLRRVTDMNSAPCRSGSRGKTKSKIPANIQLPLLLDDLILR